MPDRSDAQKRVDQIRAFRAELAAVRAAGRSPLTEEQEAELTDYHDPLLRRLAAEFDIDQSDAAGRLSRGMRLASFFGAVALTAAVYSLVERFWGGLDLPHQAFLLAAFPLVALMGVELSARRERTLYVASLFGLVAYGTFWLAVGVLGWRLNIPVTAPFIWAGAVFGFALALAYCFRVVLAMALVALAVSLAATIFTIAGVQWTEIFSRFDLLTIAGFSLLLLMQPLAQFDRTFAPVTRLAGLGIGLSGLLLLSTFGEASALPINADVIAAAYQAIMLLACIGTLVLSVRYRWNETVALVSVMFALFLFTRYVAWFWDLMPRYLFFLVLAALAFAWLFALGRIRTRLGEARA